MIEGWHLKLLMSILIVLNVVEHITLSYGVSLVISIKSLCSLVYKLRSESEIRVRDQSQRSESLAIYG